MPTVPNISFSGFFDGYSDRDRQIAEERKREQERITWMNAESERERKRLEAEEALRYWGLDDAVKAREAEALGKARNTLWTEQVMEGVRQLSPEEVARVKLAQAEAGLRRDEAMIGPMDKGTAAIGVAPSLFDESARKLETIRLGLGGTPTVSALQALLGTDAATRTEAGISLPGGKNITDAQAPTLFRSGIAGITADEISNEKAAMAILEKSVNPASTKADPRIDILQKSITGWQKRLEDTRDPVEKDRLNGLIRRADAELLTMLPLPPESTTAAPPTPARIDVSPLAPAAAQPAAPVVRAAPVAQVAKPAMVAAPVAAPVQPVQPKTPSIQTATNADQRVVRAQEWVTNDMKILASQFKSKQDELRSASKNSNPQEVLRLASELQLMRSKLRTQIGGNEAEPFIMKALGL